MPELPEVETLCSQLRKIILNQDIRDIQIIDPKLTMINDAVGRRIADVIRRGKALEIHLDNDKVMAIHLRMTGRLQWQNDQQELPMHARFTIDFNHGRLVCIDPRRFATFSIYSHSQHRVLIDDPLQSFQAGQIRATACNRKLPVKSFLMDQRIILGIGNIYACEILYDAAVNPWRKTCSLSLHEWKCIEKATKEILNRAVVCRGTTVSDWRDLFGHSGEYQHELKVYARGGCQCGRCRGLIRRERLSGRGTYFCPSCQK
jgi:formamidopyrimidine-DNA glycosylase